MVVAVHRLDAPQPEERAVRALHAHQLCQVGAPEFDCGLLLVPNGENGVVRERPLGIYLLFDDLLGKCSFFRRLNHKEPHNFMTPSPRCSNLCSLLRGLCFLGTGF